MKWNSIPLVQGIFVQRRSIEGGVEEYNSVSQIAFKIFKKS